QAADLEVVIRSHAREIFVGDPLYVEMVITNRGADAVAALPPAPELGTLRLEFFSPERSVSLRCDAIGRGFVGKALPVRYEPGKPVHSYLLFFVPHLQQLRQGAWETATGSHSVSLVYRIHGEPLSGPGVELRSNVIDVVLKRRP